MTVKILSASVRFLNHTLATPMVLSSGTILDVTEAFANVRVSVDGSEASGIGSILLSDLWAWPDAKLSHELRDRIMRDFSQLIAGQLVDRCGDDAAHPLELGLRLHESIIHTKISMPRLARAVCLSPFDAAIHDATGRAIGRSAFDFYDERHPIPSVDQLFEGGACAAIRRVMLKPAKKQLTAWVIVNRGDDLEKLTQPWVRDRNFKSFKIKLMGRDNEEDVARTIEVYRSARSWGVAHPVISVDSNEGNPDSASVMNFLEMLRSRDADVFAALKYLEQPTSRDIRAHPHDWREVSRLKSIMLDEGLTDLSLLDDVREQGWSGLAVKTCKGHSFALVAAAWAHERGMILSVQDLTNPGYAAIHSSLLAAHLPGINDVELNSPQFIPNANADWLPRLGQLFEPRDGFHHLPDPLPIGLGSAL